MDVFQQNFEIREIPLSIKSYKQRVEKFLQDNDLRLDEVDYYAGIFLVGDDKLLGGGGLKGNLIKCLAITDDLRQTGMGAKLISHLYLMAINSGENNVKVFTKPQNKDIFTSLAFRLLASSDKAILLENGDGLKKYCNYLSSLRKEGENACIIMNANPFTHGHRYLIEQASKEVDNLYIIVVKEDKSLFSYNERLQMIKDGSKDINNVTVCEGSDYQISETTFPTYFLKELTSASQTQISLDLDLFVKHIAPCLNIKKRFAGSEPSDTLTKEYNKLMSKILPSNNIEFVEIERKENEFGFISASKLRNYLKDFDFCKASQMAYPTSIPSLLSFFACFCLQTELNTTPKPGLVDKQDNGAHKDMDYNLMYNSIKILKPYFYHLSYLAYNEEILSIKDIQTIGAQAEKAMFLATKGVNTYKGALFSMGIVLLATTLVYKKHKFVEKNLLQNQIKSLSTQFSQPTDTHGEKVLKENNVKGALLSAMEGYVLLFDKWLPFVKDNGFDNSSLIKLLLFIMTDLDDTNIYYRKGKQVALEVKHRVKKVLENFSLFEVERLNNEFIKENISPGGAADMLSLT
ncbi:MAG: [citrate (pro-3S)-lyase] ligase, partial [Bacteroidota bacterium]|nr:[citrate (pro-3S)-lyase] ligase [Bacteroidota bacterium]